jgi:molecular chaperone HscB
MKCWSCGSAVEQPLLCASCGAIQPFDGALDHFALFGFAPSEPIERSELERRFRQQSKLTHPDRFVGASPVIQRIALENTDRLNHAFRVLKDSLLRIEYRLELHGTPIDREGERVRDATFLMRMLSEQEALQKLRDLVELEAKHTELKTTERALLERAESNLCDNGASRWEEAKEAWAEVQFLRRLQRQVEQRIEERN